MDISIILNCHAEGLLLHRTVIAIEKMRKHARENGLTTEVRVVLDNPSKDTLAYFDTRPVFDYKISRVSFGDLGLSRNFGVQQASGKYIALHDGDDLFSQN